MTLPGLSERAAADKRKCCAIRAVSTYRTYSEHDGNRRDRQAWWRLLHDGGEGYSLDLIMIAAVGWNGSVCQRPKRPPGCHRGGGKTSMRRPFSIVRCLGCRRYGKAAAI